MKFFAHIKKYILSGALAVVPAVLVYFVLRFLYISLNSNILNRIDTFLGFRIPGTGIIIIFFILYFLGLFASNIVGRWVFGKIEWLTQKIPLVKTTYQVGKQTPPNPMSGTIVFIPEDKAIDPGWTVDEGIRTVISAGIIGPDNIEDNKFISKKKEFHT